MSLKNKVIIIILFILLSTTGFLFGPKEPIDPTLNKISLPNNLSDLNQMIKSKEGKLKDIRPGLEKKIIFSNKTKQKTALSVVFLHGFSSSHQELSPLPERLAKTLKANLYLSRLPGHARSGEALANSNLNQWINACHESLEIAKTLGNEIIIIASSTGSSLLFWYLLEYPDSQNSIKAIIHLSPNFGISNPAELLANAPYPRTLVTLLLGKTRSLKPSNTLQDHIWTNTYPSEAVILPLRLSRHLQNQSLHTIHIPQLIFYSPNDKAISPQKMLKGLKSLPQKTLIPINNSQDKSQHVLAGDATSPNTTHSILQQTLKLIKSL